MPGCVVAKAMADLLAEKSLEGVDGLILMHHGIFTWGESARESYKRLIALVTEADNDRPLPTPPPHDPRPLPQRRPARANYYQQDADDNETDRDPQPRLGSDKAFDSRRGLGGSIGLDAQADRLPLQPAHLDARAAPGFDGKDL